MISVFKRTIKGALTPTVNFYRNFKTIAEKQPATAQWYFSLTPAYRSQAAIQLCRRSKGFRNAENPFLGQL